MTTVYRKIFPAVKKELQYWEKRAGQIPDKELRKQACVSIQTKRFHCQGGAVYALLAGGRFQEAIRFIVAYQTISDYLDNLCDRSTSMDPADFRLLHEAMRDALTPGSGTKNYYAKRNEQKDGGYLSELVRTCQDVLAGLDDYQKIEPYAESLSSLYRDLQVHKHVTPAERVSRLTDWFYKEREERYGLAWYEFSAAAGSTLGIFCLVSYGLAEKMAETRAAAVAGGYFPYLQALHILLDYYIDQEEDLEEADLNFCSYYPNRWMMRQRLLEVIEQAARRLDQLPDRAFHQLVIQGLVGLYLGQPKAREIAGSKEMARDLLRKSGSAAGFFYWNTKLYYVLKR